MAAPNPAPRAAQPKQWVHRLPGTTPRYPVAGVPSAPVTQKVVSHPVITKSCDLFPAPTHSDATPGPAIASDLPAFCTQAAPQSQAFQLQPGRDTLLLGERGTRLVIPADAFDVPAGSGSIQLELREFYSTADIVLAGLGTRATTGLLETGGMLHLYAAAAGQTVHLRAGKQILVQMPTQQQLPGMQLYEGVSADASHAPTWQLAGTGSLAPGIVAGNPLADRAALDSWLKMHAPKSPRWPRFAQGRETLLQEFNRLLPATKAEQTRLKRRRTIGKAERRELQELSRRNHTAIRHQVVVRVALDSTGQLRQSELLAGDSVLGANILAAVRQLPAQQPASFISRLPRRGRTASSVWGEFVVLYPRTGPRRIGFSWVVMDKQVQEELTLEGRRRRATFAKGFNSTSTPLTLNGGLYYELAASGLGWINCDRLLEPGPRILFAVQAPDSATVVSLVFKGSRSILASSHTEGSRAVFEQVPDGAAATVVALRRENGITYLATSGLNLRPDAQPALQFHPVSLTELRTELARL